MEGISQAEMLAFLFDAAYECEKFAKAYLSSFTQRQRAMREHLCSHMATVCEREKFAKRAYLSSFTQRQRAMREHLCSHMATVCERGKLVKRVSHSLHKRDKLRRNLA